jgi:hypothetical protein
MSHGKIDRDVNSKDELLKTYWCHKLLAVAQRIKMESLCKGFKNLNSRARKNQATNPITLPTVSPSRQRSTNLKPLQWSSVYGQT